MYFYSLVIVLKGGLTPAALKTSFLISEKMTESVEVPPNLSQAGERPFRSVFTLAKLKLEIKYELVT